MINQQFVEVTLPCPVLGLVYKIRQTNMIITDGHTGCDHNWQTYNSGWNAYKYCTKCPEKKNLDEQ